MSDPIELEMLLDTLRDGQLDEAGVARLQELLRADPENRRRYLHHMLMWSELSRGSAPAVADAAPAVSFAPPQPLTPDPQPLSLFSLRRPLMRYALAASLILCVGVIASVMNMISVQQIETSGNHPAAVATLTETQDAVFDGSDVPTSTGSQLPGGFLRLRSGTAKVVFLRGAEVTLYGPCEFGLNSEMRGFLKQGKITAYVPQQAHGFTVGAPACAVIDLGTRFTLTVGAAGQSELEVTEGKVKLEPQGGTAVSMTAGERCEIAQSGAVAMLAEAPAPEVEAVVLPAPKIVSVSAVYPQAPARYAASHLLDDQLDGEGADWAGDGVGPQTLIADFGAAVKVRQIQWANRRDTPDLQIDFVSSVTLSFSDTLQFGPDSPTVVYEPLRSRDVQNFEFPPVSGRYVKITLKKTEKGGVTGGAMLKFLGSPVSKAPVAPTP